MKHKISDLNRIQHIVESISNIETFLEGIDLKSFTENLEKRAAVERMLEIIGEATNHISEEILYKKEHSSPWRKIIATRNMIVHEYFRVDYEVLFDIVTNEIIPLKQEIQTILKDLDQYLK